MAAIFLGLNVLSESWGLVTTGERVPRVYQTWSIMFNTLRPEQNGCRFADDIFKCILLNENVCILIEIWLEFALKDPIVQLRISQV